MLELVGYFFALLIGLILGMMGAGGSIFTVPVLVYLMGINPIIATAYSLFIVGMSATVGSIKNFKDKAIELKQGLLFAIPSLIGVFASRKYIVPNLPDVFFSVGESTLTKEIFLMTLFAGIMFTAGVSMLRGGPKSDETNIDSNYKLIPLIFFAGIVVGLVGAGGGFVFVPLLMNVAKLPVKKAMATSLLIIAINSLIGFSGDLMHTTIDWKFLLTFTGFAAAGIFPGIYISRYVDSQKLKKAFGWFVLGMAVVILAKELL